MARSVFSLSSLPSASLDLDAFVLVERFPQVLQEKNRNSKNGGLKKWKITLLSRRFLRFLNLLLRLLPPLWALCFQQFSAADSDDVFDSVDV